MSQAMNILCVDTSTEACSVAVLSSLGQVTEQFMLAPREHTQKILPTVEQVLIDANIKLQDIDIVAYGQGPGSFTGVRIGISIAQGLAYGIEKKMVGVSTLQAMAQQAFDTEQSTIVYAAIDARMGEIYFAKYQENNGLMTVVDQEVVIRPADLLALNDEVEENAVLVGTGWAAFPELMTQFAIAKQLPIEFPSSQYMFKSVLQSVAGNQQVTADLATPVYLRDKVTWKKLPGRE